MTKLWCKILGRVKELFLSLLCKDRLKTDMEKLELFIWIFGMMFAALGALCMKWPHLIAGINTMKPEERAKVDLKGLGRFTCIAMMGIAIAVIVSYYILRHFEVEEVKGMLVSTLLIPFIGTFYILIGSQKYHSK